MSPLCCFNATCRSIKASVSKWYVTIVEVTFACCGLTEHFPSNQRRDVLQAIATSQSTSSTTWIFTDQQSSSQNGSASAKDYYNAAKQRGSPFISIVLECGLEENCRRITDASRGGESNTKLTDLNILRSIRNTEDIYTFGGDEELKLDVTNLSSVESAGAIAKFIGSLDHN